MFQAKKGMSLLLSVIVAASFAVPAGQAKAACRNAQTLCNGISIQSIGKNQVCINSCGTQCNSVQIGNNVVCIGANAFQDCTRMKSVTIPKQVQSVGDCAFCGCSNLSDITLGAGTEKIGANTFQNCKNLKTINIKSKKLNADCVSDDAFQGVGKNVTVNVPKSKVKSYKSLFQKKGLCKQFLRFAADFKTATAMAKSESAL